MNESVWNTVKWYWQGNTTVLGGGGTCRSGTLSTTNPTRIGLVFDFDLHAERPANSLSNNKDRNFETDHTISLCWHIILQQLTERCNTQRSIYTGHFLMYSGITKTDYKKTVGHVFMELVQIEGTTNFVFTSKLFFNVVHISAARRCECM
jgi:hypothetical protein